MLASKKLQGAVVKNVRWVRKLLDMSAIVAPHINTVCPIIVASYINFANVTNLVAKALYDI